MFDFVTATAERIRQFMPARRARPDLAGLSMLRRAGLELTEGKDPYTIETAVGTYLYFAKNGYWRTEDDKRSGYSARTMLDDIAAVSQAKSQVYPVSL